MSQPLFEPVYGGLLLAIEAGFTFVFQVELDLDFGKVGSKAELDFRIEGVELLNLFFQGRFADAESRNRRGPIAVIVADHGANPGQNLFGQHLFHLGRNPGQEKEDRPADLQGEAGGRADRVGQDFGAFRKHRLAAVGQRHRALP